MLSKMPNTLASFRVLPLWITVIAASIGTVLLLRWFAEKGINEVNDIIDPCMHGGIYNKTSMICDCSTSYGLFKGDYCEEHNCQHLSLNEVVYPFIR